MYVKQKYSIDIKPLSNLDVFCMIHFSICVDLYMRNVLFVYANKMIGNNWYQ